MNERNRYVKPEPIVDAAAAAYANEFNEMVEGLPIFRPTIGCIVPAYNEADSIGGVLDSLLAQTRLPDVIHVVVNNTTDDTVKIASEYAGPHEVVIDGIMQFTEVFVHDIGENPDKKVGALNYGYSLIEG